MRSFEKTFVNTTLCDCPEQEESSVGIPQEEDFYCVNVGYVAGGCELEQCLYPDCPYIRKE